VAPPRLSVLTLNLRNLADRWDERLPLLLAEFAALQPDVAGLQEIVYVMQQDRLLGASGAGQYEARRGWAGRPEVESLLGWLDGLPQAEASVVTGDFNAAPTQPACARMIAAGFRSAFREANGAEADVTWPSGLIAPAMDTDGDPACLDYVWVRGAVRTLGARLCFDRPAVDHPTPFPSDHRGVLVALEVG